MAPLTLVVTGPFGSIVGELIANAMLVIYNKYAVLGVFAICFLDAIIYLDRKSLGFLCQ